MGMVALFSQDSSSWKSPKGHYSNLSFVHLSSIWHSSLLVSVRFDLHSYFSLIDLRCLFLEGDSHLAISKRQLNGPYMMR